MNRQQAIEFLGKTGEKIIANLLNAEGLRVEYALNNYDKEKDFLVDGKKVEVKTEQPYVMKNAISIRDTQVRKCRSVDVLYFVTVPPLFNRSYKWGGWIFRVEPENFTYKPYVTSFGVSMVAIPIEQDAVIPIRELTKDEINELMRYAQSAYSR